MAVSSTILTLTNSTISDNTAASYGGGIYNSGGPTVRGTLTLTNSTVSGNTALSGGGIKNVSTLILTNSAVSGNTASSNGGGGIFNSGTLTLTNSTVSDNTARAGGGIANNGTMTLTDSTVSGNTASSHDGGGIHNSGTLPLTNSTISGNTGRTSGGGIFNDSTVTLTSSTITRNVAETGKGGGIRNVSATTEMVNTILAENRAPNGPDCSGLPTSLGYNLLGDDTDCGFTPATEDLSNVVDPKLGPLADNGGPTLTHALRSGSPAIDAGDCVTTTDQRRIIRPQVAGCDIGAFEYVVPGDANADGVVNAADLGILATTLGTADGADLNRDGVVDIFDLALVAINFGRPGP